MTAHLTTWGTVLVAFSSTKIAEACFDANGNFYCETKWYFWLSVFAGFLLLFIIVFCIVNHCCKKNSTSAIATPRIQSAMERQKRKRTSVRPLSNTSDWYPDTESQPANHMPPLQRTVNQGGYWGPPNKTSQKPSSHIISIHPGQSQTTSMTINQSSF